MKDWGPSRIYLAGNYDIRQVGSGVIDYLLTSFHYHDKGWVDKTRAHVNKGIFLDSGAYTAFTQGEEIPIDRYARHIAEAGPWDFVSNLDVIGDDGPKSRANFVKLRDMGANPDPVFHYSDREEYLVQMLDEGEDYIALGGMVGGAPRVLQEWLDRVWNTYLTDREGRPVCRVHGFGLTSIPLLRRYPWFSADSSSWIQAGIRGACLFVHELQTMYIVFTSDKTEGTSDPLSRNTHYGLLTEPEKKMVCARLAERDLTPELCGEHWRYRFQWNAYEFQKLSRLIPATLPASSREMSLL